MPLPQSRRASDHDEDECLNHRQLLSYSSPLTLRPSTKPTTNFCLSPHHTCFTLKITQIVSLIIKGLMSRRRLVSVAADGCHIFKQSKDAGCDSGLGPPGAIYLGQRGEPQSIYAEKACSPIGHFRLSQTTKLQGYQWGSITLYQKPTRNP